MLGSLVSPKVANLFMEYFEQKALSTATNPPRIWLRYVGDTFVIQKEEHKQHFVEHIYSVDPAIRFTVEDNKENGAIPFLDTIVKQEADNTLSVTVYKKPTHMDQSIQWDIHHHLSAKYSVINTLTHRAKTVDNKPELLQKELDHLRKALSHCKYHRWAIGRVERRFSQFSSEKSNNANTQVTAGTMPTSTEAKTNGYLAKLGPSIGSSMENLHVMRSI